MRDESEAGTSPSPDIGGIRLNKDVLNRKKVLESLLGVEKSDLPDLDSSLIQSIVSEVFRQAAASSESEKREWPIVNVLHLRSWVLRKVRGILLGDDGVVEEVVMNVLDGRKGPSMVFMGDFISLPSGYYVGAPTRAIPISDDTCVLVSGKPSTHFRRANLHVRINGLSRWIVGIETESLPSRNLCLQARDSYLERSIAISDPQTFLEVLARSGLKSEWSMLPGSEVYLGPVVDRYHFHWGTSSPGVSTPIGLVKIVRLQREFSMFDHFMRIENRSGTYRVPLDPRHCTRVLLAYDALTRSPRKATLAVRDSAIILGLDFPPPAAEMRWIYALGGAFLGLSGSRIKWRFPEVVKPRIEEMLRDMWLNLDVGGS
jgi:hypothetical protein